MNRILSLFIASVMMVGCHTSGTDNKGTAPALVASPADNARALVTVRTYNHYNQKTGEGLGFYVARNRVITNLDLVQGSYKVKISPMGIDDFSDVDGYTAYSYASNLIVMQPFVRCKAPLDLSKSVAPSDTLLSLFWNDRQLFTRKMGVAKPVPNDSVGRLLIGANAKLGDAAFSSAHGLCGIVQSVQAGDSTCWALLPASQIALLMTKQNELKPIFDLATKTNKTYPSYTTVKGVRIVTNKGTITIALSNDVPEYRDNFIRLVSDGFYDSLLVHRVIKNCLIQTGGADTKYAQRDDVVGWQGPGYTLPVIVKPNLFHQRGAVAAAKLPSDRNPRNRCDGSQFYMVSGRVYSDAELDDLEKSKKIKYSSIQRQAYTTVGGAPHLDGDYTVFAHVTSGIELVEQLSRVETYGVDRPVNDIRIKRAELIRY